MQQMHNYNYNAYLPIMELGAKIKRLREERNYSQKYMAQKLNISQSQYSRIENNLTTINITKIEKISATLDKPISYFLDKLSPSNERVSLQSDEKNVLILELSSNQLNRLLLLLEKIDIV